VAKPTGFVATCQCGKNVAALDLDRTMLKDASRLLGEWLMRGCTVTPRFTHTWTALIESCECAAAGVSPSSTDQPNTDSAGRAYWVVKPSESLPHDAPSGGKGEATGATRRAGGTPATNTAPCTVGEALERSGLAAST
jgi:hypothetical protein